MARLSLVCTAMLAVNLALLGQTSPDIGHTIVSYLQEGRYAEASQLLQQALKENPRNARLWTLNGLSLVQSGKSAEALASFSRSLQLAPDYIPALEAAAQIELEHDDARAAPLLQHILKLRPADQTAHVLLAGIAFKHGDCETAKQEIAGAQLASGEIGVLKEFGSCLVAQRRVSLAVPVFKRIIELQPEDQASRFDYANVEFLAGNYSHVIETLRPLVAEDPSNADALDLLAEAYEANLDYDNAAAALHRAIAIHPESPRYYVDFAYLCLAHRDYQKGIDIVNEGLRRVSSSASLYVVRGILFGELAQYDQAENDFLAAERLDQNVELVSAAKALTELQENDLPKAEQTVRERLRQHPTDSMLHYLLADVLAKEGAAPGTPPFKEAIAAASAALKLKPDLALARELLGRLYLMEGQVGQSIEQSKIAVQLNPNDEAALYHLIVALKKADKTDEVAPLLQRLVALKQRSRTQQAMDQKVAAVDKNPISQPQAAKK